MIKIQTGSIFTYVLFIPLLLVYHVWEDIKQAFYILPILTIVYLLIYQYFTKEKLELDKGLFQSLILLCLSAAIASFLNPYPLYGFTLARDMIIIGGPMIIFMWPLRFSHRNMIVLLFVAMLCYLIWIGFKVDFVFLKSLFKSNYDTAHEYDYGTIVGIFILYFLYKKDYKFLALSILYLLFANKRATYLGLLPAIGAYYVGIKFLKLDRNKWYLFAFLASYYVFFYLVGTHMISITECFLEVFDKKNIKVDSFLTGRVVMIQELTREIYGRGFMNYLFGNGPGQADFYLWEVIKNPIYNFYTRPINPHNDFLKLHFDLGLMGIVLYFIIMYYLYIVSNVGIMIFLYIVPLFLIENTLIYYPNLILCGIAARATLEDTSHFLLFKRQSVPLSS